MVNVRVKRRATRNIRIKVGMSVMDYLITCNPNVVKLANGKYSYTGEAVEDSVYELLKIPALFETNIYFDELEELERAFKVVGITVERDEPMTDEDDTTRVDVSWSCTISEFIKGINELDNEELASDLLYILTNEKDEEGDEE
jgi:hypothetical protein